MAKQNKHVLGKTVGVAVGVAALSAAAYLLFGPEGNKNRKHVRGWAVKMKGEIIEKFEEAKELTEPVYNKIIDQVSEKYAKVKNIDQAELKATIADIRKHWKAMQKGTKKVVKKAIPKKVSKKK